MTSQPAAWLKPPEIEKVTYRGPHGKFKVKYEKTSDKDIAAFWNEFQRQTNTYREAIPSTERVDMAMYMAGRKVPGRAGWRATSITLSATESKGS